tara:strand:+ start:261 stop:896 length:636 start_codon:yes stop_codon:yes gene_type:complete
MTTIGLYPATGSVLEYLSEVYECVDISVISAWHAMSQMRELAEMFDCGELDRISAARLIQSQNRALGTDYSLDEVMDNYAGLSWPQAVSGPLVFFSEDSDTLAYAVGEQINCADPIDALVSACEAHRSHLNTVILVYEWTPMTVKTLHSETSGPSALVIKSQRVHRCEHMGMFRDEHTVCDALSPGVVEAYALPRGIHGLIKQEKGEYYQW